MLTSYIGKKVDLQGRNYVTVLPGVQQISNRSYRVRVQINGEKHTRLFTSMRKASAWYKEMKRTKF